jgi:hypothetical protein
MPPRTKYEDTVYEKIEYSGKIFMYSSVSWNVLFPVVDIIRILKKNTIIGFKYGKGQQMVRTYSQQYNHCVLGYDLKNKNDYINNLKAVKNIFIFSDESDIVATNLINVASKNKINVICYSNLDKTYHFYDNVNSEKYEFKTPSETISKMYDLIDLEGVRKIANLFPDFEIIETPESSKHSTLEECSNFLKEQKQINLNRKKEKNYTQFYDPNLNRIKKMEYDRATRNTVYPDSVEILNKNEENKRKTLLSRFFAKNK